MTDKIKIIIYTTLGGIFIAKGIKKMFNKNNIDSKIVNNITQIDIDKNNLNPNEYFFIIFPHTLNLFPSQKKYIIYQLEQYKQSPWINDQYKERMLDSLITFDYSLENFRNFNENIQSKIYYLPIPIKNNFNIILSDFSEYDLLIFGSENERRNKIIRHLSKKYNILFIKNLYGNDLYKIIQKSKIILNIHFYLNAILETCRINETLYNNKLIISEEPDKEDWLNRNIYKNNIVFVEEIKDNLSNINKLEQLIDFYLDKNNYSNFMKNNENFIKKLNKISFYYFTKGLNECGLINTPNKKYKFINEIQENIYKYNYFK